MRIGISLLNFRPGAVGGIETFIRNVIEHAPPVAGGDDVLFFVNRSNRQVVPSGFHVVEVPWSQFQTDVARVLEAFTPWRASSVERLIAHHDLDVLFFTQQSMFPTCCPVPSVLLVADLQYLITPAYYSRFDRAFRAQGLSEKYSQVFRHHIDFQGDSGSFDDVLRDPAGEDRCGASWI